jgi:hypothetical protein
MTNLLQAAQDLVDSIADDNSRHGGLLSRETTRRADECRVIINRILTAARQIEPEPNKEPGPCDILSSSS